MDGEFGGCCACHRNPPQFSPQFRNSPLWLRRGYAIRENPLDGELRNLVRLAYLAMVTETLDQRLSFLNQLAGNIKADASDMRWLETY